MLPRARDEGARDADGRIFILNEDAERTLGRKVGVPKPPDDPLRKLEPLAIRSNVGDCVKITFTSGLPEKIVPSTKLPERLSKVNIHSHFVQFDPQASDGVITGFSFEQSVRPFLSEHVEDDGRPTGRWLQKAVAPGDLELAVNAIGKLRPGIWIGVGLGEGMCSASRQGCPTDERPVTEIRRIATIDTNRGAITLESPLTLRHEVHEFIGVEFVQYMWYSDVDVGTVFWHDHVDFNSWTHGLVGAHIVEPSRSTWHDPKTGTPIRSGTIADIHASASSSIGARQRGSFRELVLFQQKGQTGQEMYAAGDKIAPTINLSAEPIKLTLGDGSQSFAEIGREGEPAYWFSSVRHGDPFTPLPEAYAGDPFVIRHVGVLNRVGGLRVTGHRFRLERWAATGALSDTSPIGISERYDLVLDGGAGNGRAGDYLYYSTIARDFLAGAWGLIRVHDTLRPDLMPLPGHDVVAGDGFPQQQSADHWNSNRIPKVSESKDTVCPSAAPKKEYKVTLRRSRILRPPGRPLEGVAYGIRGGPIDSGVAAEPLVLRANEGDCLVVHLKNEVSSGANANEQELPGGNVQRVGIYASKLTFDPRFSYGAAIGLNEDSSIEGGAERTYYYYADTRLGTAVILDLANPSLSPWGAFGAAVVEPGGSRYLDPQTGAEVQSGTIVDIDVVGTRTGYREVVALFVDRVARIGQNTMDYLVDIDPIQDQGNVEKALSDADRSYPSLSYTIAPLYDRGKDSNPAAAFATIGIADQCARHCDPGLVVTGYRGDPLVFRVASPWGDQPHVFSVMSHRWSLEPGMNGSAQVSAHFLPPGYTFDAPIIGGFGTPYGKTGDFLFLDHEWPLLEAGVWGIVASVSPP
jgi:hypothetical protein